MQASVAWMQVDIATRMRVLQSRSEQVIAVHGRQKVGGIRYGIVSVDPTGSDRNIGLGRRERNLYRGADVS